MTDPQTSSKSIEVFFSYSHKDEEMRDELEKHLSILKHRGLISAWHDRKIDAGEEWKGEIDEHLNMAQIILLLISADFLASKYCYDIEMKRAMERHESGEARVMPIILRHVHWKGSPFSKLQALPTNAEPIQGGKWRSFDEAFTDVAKGLEKAIKGLEFEPKSTKSGTFPVSNSNEPKNIIVDQWYRGDFVTITDAITAATPGSRILVHSGVYDEELVIDKTLEIAGDGKLGDVILRATGKNAILFKAVRGKISNIMMKQNGGDEVSCVDITSGCLEIVNCDISGSSSACIAVHGTSYPKIIDNSIHDSKGGSGIFVYGNGQGIIEGNDIYGNAVSGVGIKGDCNPTIKNNKIHDSKGSGVYVSENGQGIIECNDIYCNVASGIEISKGGNPKVISNRIHDGRGSGVFVYEKGEGVIEGNDIFCNAGSGIDISNGGNPKIVLNKIHDCRAWGIHVSSSHGVIEGNDIFSNVVSNIGIYSEGNPNIIRNKIHDGKSWGIFVDKSQGVIEENDISQGSLSIHISDDSNSILRGNRIK